MSPIIKVQNLKKTYAFKRQKVEAVKDVSFEVNKGEIFGILGPNGAGKTTTLEIIECIHQQDSGSVEVLGFDNLKQSDEIKKRIGVQLQSSQYLHHLSLTELLDLFRSLYSVAQAHGLPDILQQTNKQAMGLRYTNADLLKLVNLQDKAKAEFSKLSGGQKQRFTIATSLVHNPEVLFLDEPTTGLDPKARRDMWQLVKQINASGITIILTTHYMEEAEFLCHRVAIMDQGKILEIDEPKKLIDRLADTTQIAFFTDGKINEEVFKKLPSVTKIYAEYPKVILEINDLRHIAEVVDVLKSNQINFYGFTVKTASLEDVYLDLTGHEFEL